MSEKEYIVTLNKGVDYDQFNQDMIASTGGGAIPERSVNVADARPGSLRNTHYALTADEVTALRNDSRVLDVAVPPDQDDNLEIGLNASESVTFYKGHDDDGQYYDWGKHRHSIMNETSAWDPTLSGTYNYILDGTGVDVVIQDSGLQVDHPEFVDAQGNSRVQQINWATASGLSFTQNANHYRDYEGHGTHCAGTAAGLTFGWARNAHIYALKVSGLEGSGDSGTGIAVANCFDAIKLWHRNKPIDPITGRKRPTIVNMSWGYSTTVGSMTSVTYRGTTYNTGNDAYFNSSPNSHMRDTYGVYPYYSNGAYRCPTRVTSVDTDVEELIDEGVHVCIAAGNNSFKIDLSGGDDYNNYLTRGTSVYYHRGSSPYSAEAFMVGSLLAESSTSDRKVDFSSAGPGVDIYAAGDEITSCTSNTNAYTDAAYWGDSGFRQANINGTSMASPQICGIGALYLQANPGATPAELRTMIHNDSNSTAMKAGTSTGYGSTDNAMNGPRRVAVQRYNTSVPYVNNLTGKYNIRS